MLIKRQLLLLLGLLMAASTARAELEIIETPRSGLEFQVGSDFQLESFMGTMISWKRLTSEHRGWRVGVSPTVAQDFNSHIGYDNHRWETDSNVYSIDLVVHKLYLGTLKERTRSYWGIGPTVGFAYEDEKNAMYDDNGERMDRQSRVTRRWNVGVSAVIGVEYFFLHNMSLHGEYGVNLKYNHSETSIQESTTKYFHVYSRSVRLGLSVLY